MKQKKITTLFIIAFLFILRTGSEAKLLQENLLAGTKWDVFVKQSPICLHECGKATITFGESGTAGLLDWDEPGIAGLVFHYSEMFSFGDLIFFNTDLSGTCIGYGMAVLDRTIKIIMFRCGYFGYVPLNLIIYGIPSTE
jgi:hypothetical protein